MQKSKIKNQNYNLKFKTFAFLVLVFSFAFLVFSLVPLALGQSPTPDERVEEIREAVKEKVQATRTGQKRAFVGEISDRTETMVTIDTRQGERQAKVGEETTIIGLERKEIELADLEIGSFVITMGYLEEADILDARRIVISKKPEFPARLVAYGKVDDKSSEEKILTVIHPKRDTVYMVDITGTTKITQKIEGEMESIKFDDIEIGDRLVAIGAPTEENENFIAAKIIHVIPGLAVGLEKATPTPEAVEEATPTPETAE